MLILLIRCANVRCSAGYKVFLDLDTLDKYLIPIEYAPKLSPEVMQRLSYYIRTGADPVAAAPVPAPPPAAPVVGAAATAAGASKEGHRV